MDDSRFHAEESLEKCLADAYESMRDRKSVV